MTLVEFVNARIAEDESLALAMEPAAQRHPYGDRDIPPTPFTALGAELLGYLGGPLGEHAARWHPARVLAECAAKRRVIAIHPDGEHGCRGEREIYIGIRNVPEPEHFSEGACPTQCALALPYADHPDYDESWRPDGLAGAQHGPTASYGDG